MSVKIEESLCADCIHFKRLMIKEMRNSFSLKCEAQERYIKTPKRSCSYFEPVTWEMFLGMECGGEDEN